MHILLINSEYPPIGGGAGNASANIARELAALGIQVSVVTVHFGNLPREEIVDNVTIYRISSLRRRQDRSGALEQIAFILSASFWTLSWSRQKRPNATLAFFGVPSGAAALCLKWFYKIPYIVSLRGGDVPGFRPYDFKTFHKLIAPFLRVIWKNASAIIANSNGLRDLALAFDSRFQIPVIPNGVDLEKYTVPERDWSSPRLLSAGRIVHQKGLDLGLRALSQLKDLEWTWSIAGDGPQLENLKSLAGELGIADRVHFLGWQSREELTKQYQQANIFLFPSRHEGMPNAVLEAMSTGLPVVATRIAGSEELVIEGETGFLVQTENVDELRDALHRILIDSKPRKKMGFASRQRVEENYSWKNVAEQYKNILDVIASEAKQSPNIEKIASRRS
ncbi:MAG: glycosyltransferase family 4 protein [Anaerolineales bacterium]|nr:glycosyltransferase family 4 protein [Anaerolineales bacterium]